MMNRPIPTKESLHDSYSVTITPPNAIDVMVLNIDLRLHRFMHKKRKPLMTRRARRKMVR